MQLSMDGKHHIFKNGVRASMGIDHTRKDQNWLSVPSLISFFSSS